MASSLSGSVFLLSRDPRPHGEHNRLSDLRTLQFGLEPFRRETCNERHGVCVEPKDSFVVSEIPP